MSEDSEFTQPKKLKVDKNKKYHIKLPSGGERTIELTEKEIYAVENWFHLVGKHKLRADIVNILRIYGELNITQISNFVKQSKPTVSRHLKSLEEDGMLVSELMGKYERGKIPPLAFRLNQKVVDVVENCPIQPPEPSKPKELMKFFQREIDSHRAIIQRYRIAFDKLSALLDMFETKLGDEEVAKEIWRNYFDENTTNTFPTLGYFYFSEKYFKEFDKAYLVYTKKLIELLAKQNTDPEVKDRDFIGINANLPIKALYEIYRREILGKGR